MDTAVFEQVYGAFQDFFAYFAALFGRRETRDRSRHYLQVLLVQSGERRNAENLSETVPASARAMQQFLTESPWDDDTVIGRLQEYLGPRLEHPDGVCLLGGAFLLSLQQAWGKKMPRITRPQVYRVVSEMLPRERFGPAELLRVAPGDAKNATNEPGAPMPSAAPPFAPPPSIPP